MYEGLKIKCNSTELGEWFVFNIARIRSDGYSCLLSAHKTVTLEVSSETHAFKELYLYSSISACSVTGKILYFPVPYGGSIL